MGSPHLNPWFTAALFLALVSGTVGVSLFALGATFNYLVAIFYKRPIRQGCSANPSLNHPWITNLVGWESSSNIWSDPGTFVLLQGWEVTRLWLYLLGSATLVLIGVQLSISWFLMRVLDELSQREMQVLNGIGNGNG